MRAIAVQIFPRSAAAWWGNPHLPSRARGFLSISTAEAYRAAGQAISALHAMVLLQAYQTKALKQLHEGSSNSGLMQELHTYCTPGPSGDESPSVRRCPLWWFPERHLWLNLADMRESDKHQYLDSPISQAGLFGKAVESLAHFSAAQKRTEVIIQQSLPQ